MRKIKVFLGGYINYTNAQNLNCLAISLHLDKEKFEILTLTTDLGEKKDLDAEIKTFNCFWPFSLSRIICFIWGILNCDIAYLPKKIDTPIWVLKLAKMLGKPIFTTLEGNVLDMSQEHCLLKLFGSEQKMRKYFSYFNKIYPITKHLSEQVIGCLDIVRTPLYLGVDGTMFYSNIQREQLKQIVYVGHMLKRKGVEQLLKLAEQFSSLSFVLVGDGADKNYLEAKAGENVKFLGTLSHQRIKEIFSESDLFFLPSISEGFPKVILEAASAGIPSIVYNTYGASDWIEHKTNGFIVNNFENVQAIVNLLISDSELLQITSKNAIKLAERFEWKNVIKDWQVVINNLYNGE